MKLDKIGILVIMLFVTLYSADALFASIGNARMILRPEIMPGDEITLDQTIFVQNINPIEVHVTVQPDESFLPYVDVIDDDFVLAPNETKDAQIKIRIPEPGRYEGRILVSFAANNSDLFNETPVGLSSNIIIITKNVTEYSVQEPVEEPEQNATEDLANDLNNTAENNSQEDPGSSLPLLPLAVVGLIIIGVTVYVLGGNKRREK